MTENHSQASSSATEQDRTKAVPANVKPIEQPAKTEPQVEPAKKV